MRLNPPRRFGFKLGCAGVYSRVGCRVLSGVGRIVLRAPAIDVLESFVCGGRPRAHR